MTTIFLIWTLWAGVPYDVDAFIDQKVCVEAMEAWQENVRKAREARPEVLAQLALVGCVPLEISVPAAPAQRKESM